MKIKSVTLFSSNLEAQKSFYIDKLGFKLNSDSDQTLSIQAGQTELRFEKSSTQPFYHYCFLVPKNRLTEAMNWMQTRTDLIQIDGEYLIETTTMWNAESFYFYDGNGNISEFITHYDLDNESSDDFSADSVISVNEIGCPNHNIEAINSWLEQEVGTRFWTGDKIRFGTNGNAEGCFLLVNNEVKKTWFPTEHFPESAPLRLSIEHHGTIYQLQFGEQGFKHD